MTVVLGFDWLLLLEGLVYGCHVPEAYSPPLYSGGEGVTCPPLVSGLLKVIKS